MKFDKRLVESGIVAAFSLMLSVSSVYGANAATQVPDDQTVELSAEPAEVSDKAEAAAKVRTIREVVASSITENEPEQKAEEQESPQKENAEENASKGSGISVGILDEALKEETSGTENSENASALETEKAPELEMAEGKTENSGKEKTEKPSEESKPEENNEIKTEESGQEEVAEKTPETSDIEEKASDTEETEAEGEDTGNEGQDPEKTEDPEEGGKPEDASKAEEEQNPEGNEEKSQPEDGEEGTPDEAAEGEPENKEGSEDADGSARDGLVAVGSQEVSPWAAKLLPNVEDYLNIRTEPSDEAELAGKLHKEASADILEQGEEWTKISSGSVEGYVKNEFCVTGLAAEELANQVGTVYATAVTGGVRIREQASASEDTTVMDVLEEGGRAKVDTEAEAPEGWVVVKMEEGVGYVSAEYVDVELKLGKAISIEEERAAIAAAEAEKAKKAQQASSGTSQRGAVSASYDDVTLLGALIQCEAGSEPYEGKLAVGAVVMNRLRAGYAGSISGVIYQSGQFTPASSGALARVLASGVSGSCIQAAQEAIGGASNVGGATSFRNTASGASGIVIGNHVFF